MRSPSSIINLIEWVICVFSHAKYGYDYVKAMNSDGCKFYKKCKECGRLWEEPC